MAALDISQIPIDIALDNEKYRSGTYLAPRQDIPESEKTPYWFWQNINYILTFYNRPVGTLAFPNAASSDNANQRGAADIPNIDREYPVQFMIRMMQYYLGKQPNMNYNWLTSDITRSNMQAQWIRGQEVSEFVNFFKGSIMGRTSNAFFTARPISKDAASARTDMYDKLMLKHDMAPFFAQMGQMGSDWSPANGANFQMPEEVDRWMDTNFIEFGAEIAGDLANGIWFTNGWLSKTLQAFMHVTITALCAMEHYVENGRTMQRIRMPYQLIIDNRKDNDYGEYDEFIGVIDNMTPMEIYRRFPGFTPDQRRELDKMCQDKKMGDGYNIGQNIIWWNYGSIYRDNSISVVTVYFKTRHDLGLKKKVNRNGIEKFKKAKAEEITDSVVEDIMKCSVIGNRWMTAFGYIDNVVEVVGNKSKTILPIIRFRPNTFMGESISEVARIHRIQDELDMYDFKIREMIGRAAGKTYIVRGSKLGDATPKQLFEDLKGMGIHIADDSGEAEDPDNNRRLVEEIDMTLDPNITALTELYIERRERMGRIMSTSQASMGQVSKYMGLGSLQNAQQQSNLGVAYLMDGFMEWIVLNMRYAVNQQVKIAAFGKEEALEFLIGDRGVAYIQLLNKQKLKFEEFFVILNINDVIDAQRKERLITIAQSESQNGKFSMSEFVKLENARSLTELQELLDYSEKQRDKKQAQIDANNAKMASAQSQQIFLEKAELQQLKDDNENFRQQLKLLADHIGNMNDLLAAKPAVSPVAQQFVPQQLGQGGQPDQENAQEEAAPTEEVEQPAQ